MSRLRGLYAITDGSGDVIAQVEAVLAGGARVVQYRDKTTDRARRVDEATALRARCHAHGVLFLVNDDVQLALSVGADGVHLGRGDMPLSTARQLLGGDAIIGATCHASLELADAAVAAGADYIAFGAFFPSVTKPDAERAPIALLTQARARYELPICAIGGITPENGRQLVAAGADLLAATSALFGSGDTKRKIRGFSYLWSP